MTKTMSAKEKYLAIYEQLADEARKARGRKDWEEARRFDGMALEAWKDYRAVA